MKKYWRHFLFCFIYFWYGYLTDKVNEPETHILSSVLYFTTHSLFLFYSFLFILRFSFTERKKIGTGILLFALDIVVFVCLRYLVRFYFIPGLNIPEPASLNLKIHLINGVLWIVQYFFYASGYFYFTQAIAKEKQLRIVENEIQRQTIENMLLRQKQLEAEKEKMHFENTVLRAQINPHFLFNTLGYFYNEVSSLHPQVGEGIAALADIMRSAIRQPDADGLIPLEDELRNIEQLISIYKLRYDNGVFIYFQEHGNSAGLRILPHTFTTLVENGLKHGEIHNAKHPFLIHIEISDQTLIFKAHNKKRIGPKELSHGIGMDILRSHLDTVYEDCYDLSITEDDIFYTAELTLNIKEKTGAAVTIAATQV